MTIQVKTPLITAEHLGRKAIVYVRQSSQIREETGRIDQLQLARSYGWTEDLIEVIDEDTGKSGSSVEHRTGWRCMLDQIIAGGVAAIFAASVSRLSRQVIEYEQLRMLASEHGTLLCIGNRVIDPSSSND
jgi:DNA invertase Pin-like site-specific DNA recombinase